MITYTARNPRMRQLLQTLNGEGGRLIADLKRFRQVLQGVDADASVAQLARLRLSASLGTPIEKPDVSDLNMPPIARDIAAGLVELRSAMQRCEELAEGVRLHAGRASAAREQVLAALHRQSDEAAAVARRLKADIAAGMREYGADEDRRHPRFGTCLRAHLRTDNLRREALIADVSTTGLRLAGVRDLEIGRCATIELEDGYTLTGTCVRKRGYDVAVLFDRPVYDLWESPLLAAAGGSQTAPRALLAPTSRRRDALVLA